MRPPVGLTAMLWAAGVRAGRLGGVATPAAAPPPAPTREPVAVALLAMDPVVVPGPMVDANAAAAAAAATAAAAMVGLCPPTGQLGLTYTAFGTAGGVGLGPLDGEKESPPPAPLAFMEAPAPLAPPTDRASPTPGIPLGLIEAPPPLAAMPIEGTPASIDAPNPPMLVVGSEMKEWTISIPHTWSIGPRPPVGLGVPGAVPCGVVVDAWAGGGCGSCAPSGRAAAPVLTRRPEVGAPWALA